VSGVTLAFLPDRVSEVDLRASGDVRSHKIWISVFNRATGRRRSRAVCADEARDAFVHLFIYLHEE
jgi:hypothetical protein